MTEGEQLTHDRVWASLRHVIDPEIGIDIVTLGLVYGVEVRGGEVLIDFSLTTPGCPMEHAIRGGIVHAAQRVSNVEAVHANLVWEPRWNPGMAAPGAL